MDHDPDQPASLSEQPVSLAEAYRRMAQGEDDTGLAIAIFTLLSLVVVIVSGAMIARRALTRGRRPRV